MNVLLVLMDDTGEAHQRRWFGPDLWSRFETPPRYVGLGPTVGGQQMVAIAAGREQIDETKKSFKIEVYELDSQFPVDRFDFFVLTYRPEGWIRRRAAVDAIPFSLEEDNPTP